MAIKINPKYVCMYCVCQVKQNLNVSICIRVYTCCDQLQAKLSRVQVLAADGGTTSDSRDSFNDDASDSDANASVEKSQQVGPKSHMSLLDQHSKLKLEALGSCISFVAFVFIS